MEEYYNGMPGTDIVNRNAQYLIGIEEAVRTKDVFKRMACTVIGTWVANAYGMTCKWYPNDRKEDLTTQTFVSNIILGGLFPKLCNQQFTGTPNSQISDVTNNTNTDVSTARSAPLAVTGLVQNTRGIDEEAVDPYVHTMRAFAELDDLKRQQRCVMCIAENRRSMTSYYCALCAVTATREYDRKPTKHAYCINPKYQCFSRHIANCYTFMNRTGKITAQRREVQLTATPLQAKLPIAGAIVSNAIPKRRKPSRRLVASKNKRQRKK